MKLAKTDFDLAVSLGGNCSAAGQLKHRGLRRFSLPLDWTWMANKKPVEMIPELFTTKFRSFLRWENAVQERPPKQELGKKTFQVTDTYSGLMFTHHFRGEEFSKEMFERERTVMQRRIDRLYSEAEKARSILFVLETAFAFEDALATDIYAALSKVFPSSEIHLVVMEFSSPEESERRLNDGRVTIARHARPLNIVYDNQFTTHEWCWMDSLKISGVTPAEELRKKSLRVKWAYKLWRALGKWLEDKGAGVLNVRFRDFKLYTVQDSIDYEQANG